jgi:hypothetical protein
MALNTALDMRSIATRAARFIWDPRRLVQNGLPDGADVLSWPDEMQGLLLNTTTVTGIDPTLVHHAPAALNEPAIRFYGRTIGESYMDSASDIDWSLPISYVVAFVPENDQGPPPQLGQSIFAADAADGPGLELRDAGVRYHNVGWYHGGAASPGTPAMMADDTPVLAIARYNNPECILRVQGTNVMRYTTAQLGTNDLVGDAVRICAYGPTPGTPFRGLMLYFAMFNTTLSDEEVSQIEQNLLARFGIAGTVSGIDPSSKGNEADRHRQVWFGWNSQGG